jgi:glycosyltransferase involved in cell wall biosynthesis
MRILFYSSIFPRPWDTTRGIYCYHTCRALGALGHDVRVVSPRLWTERRPRSGAPARPLAGLSGMQVTYPTYLYTPFVFRTAYDRFMWASSARAVRRTTRELRPQCVLSYWAHPDGAAAARFARAAGIPAVVVVGGSDVLILTTHGPARRRSVARALTACDAVITVGRGLADAVEALGVPSSRVHVVYQGVDAGLFAPGPRADARQRLGVPLGGHVLSFVGSLLPVKGVDVLLDSVARLRGRGTNLRLYLVGDGPCRGALEAQAARLALGDVVRFVGAVDQTRLPDWYRAANLTVLPSRSEGVPNVLRESLACGTPFVATRVGGVHEVSNGTANPLVPPGDPVALADAIADSLAAPPAGTAADSLSWEQSARQLLAVLDPLVA